MSIHAVFSVFTHAVVCLDVLQCGRTFKREDDRFEKKSESQLPRDLGVGVKARRFLTNASLPEDKDF